MSKYKPYCLIRNLDQPELPTASMDCEIILERAKKGYWGENWQLEECVIVEGQSASVLRVIGRSTKYEGFQFMFVDQRFDEYFGLLKMPAPESEALKLLNKK